jgi:hypothetical protein
VSAATQFLNRPFTVLYIASTDGLFSDDVSVVFHSDGPLRTMEHDLHDLSFVVLVSGKFSHRYLDGPGLEFYLRKTPKIAHSTERPPSSKLAISAGLDPAPESLSSTEQPPLFNNSDNSTHSWPS